MNGGLKEKRPTYQTRYMSQQSNNEHVQWTKIVPLNLRGDTCFGEADVYSQNVRFTLG